jgi:chromosomal replication initiator protein
VTPDPALIWERIQEELRQAVPASMYDIWLEPLRLVGVDGSALVLEAPRELHAWVADRFSRVLETCSAAVLGEEVSVDVRAGGSSARPRQGRHADARRERAVRAAPAPEADTVVTERLNAKYTFDQFVIGDTNRFAHAAALAVAELPGQAYNPLFIYGPPGVGKTHLLHSIGNYVRAYGGGLSVRYTTVETFTNQFVQALRDGSVEQFKGRYRRNDVLLIDDVQFLQSKAKTEEEFFHTFNALYEIGSQLVLTSDRLPRDLDALEDRLCERFESGLVTDIQAPDHATRMTVLRKRVQHDGIAMADEAVLEAIAERVPTNIRALEGALIRVVAFSSLTGRPLSPDLAGEVLGELYPGAAPQIGASRISVEQIQEITAAAFGLTRDELLSDSRVAGITWPRQVAMYLVREHTDATLPAIGRSFGGRNHTTVMHACRRAAQRLAADPEAFEIVRRLTDELGAREQDAPGARRPDRRG